MSLAHVQTLAVHTLTAVQNGKNLSDELAYLLAQNPALSPQDKGMLQDITYGCQRFSGSLNYMLGKMLKKPLQQIEVQNYLLVALYQLNHTRNAPHAVVNEAVQHIAQLGHGQYRSFANAILRRFLREKDTLNRLCQTDVVARYNLPIWLQKTIKNQYPKYWHNIFTALQSHPPLTLRVNRRRSNAEKYLAQLNAAGIAGKILDEYAVLVLDNVPVAQLPHFFDGVVSVQDWGAQQAIPLLAPQNGERILDACAAPGGKTGHILEYADCDLTALDIDETRLQRVRENLARLQFQAATFVAPAQNIAKWYDNRPFDAILADLPCTASGTIKRNPDIKWLRRPTDALKTARQQPVLLDALWQTLKSGGRMLLATCSLFEEENQMQCRQFLHRHHDAVLHTETMLLPNQKQDGFYYALLYKHA